MSKQKEVPKSIKPPSPKCLKHNVNAILQLFKQDTGGASSAPSSQKGEVSGNQKKKGTSIVNSEDENPAEYMHTLLSSAPTADTGESGEKDDTKPSDDNNMFSWDLFANEINLLVDEGIGEEYVEGLAKISASATKREEFIQFMNYGVSAVQFNVGKEINHSLLEYSSGYKVENALSMGNLGTHYCLISTTLEKLNRKAPTYVKYLQEFFYCKMMTAGSKVVPPQIYNYDVLTAFALQAASQHSNQDMAEGSTATLHEGMTLDRTTDNDASKPHAANDETGRGSALENIGDDMSSTSEL
ncbi:hypothetical protein GYMLUDRAFT_237211 [Collybiopsis luxurians FD-317 M1]|nr:hypothetical protein GYMLUDRAFT_237211 [Collybiopsis luxurians FD-317 M1]